MKPFAFVVLAAMLAATTDSWADSVGHCGPNNAPGDYVETPTGRLYCETSWSGPWKLAPYALAALTSLYRTVNQYDSLWVIGFGLLACWCGGRLAALPVRVAGSVSNGGFNGSWHPAVEGSAKTVLGRLLGVLLQLAAYIVLTMGVVSCVSGH